MDGVLKKESSSHNWGGDLSTLNKPFPGIKRRPKKKSDVADYVGCA